jgi:GNAT superfamily N-acetyltransferase
MEIRRLGREGVDLVARIDRSERVDVEYEVRDGEIVERPVTMEEVPPWNHDGDGPHSVAAEIAFCRRAVAGGGVVVGAYEGDEVAGLAVVDPGFEPRLAWLAFLHVSRPHRRRGVATALWAEAVAIAAEAGAAELYVSAVPTGSAVGFYLDRGCRLAAPVHPELFAAEPDDIHLVCGI